MGKLYKLERIYVCTPMYSEADGIKHRYPSICDGNSFHKNFSQVENSISRKRYSHYLHVKVGRFVHGFQKNLNIFNVLSQVGGHA
jgi:hypothetical protein